MDSRTVPDIIISYNSYIKGVSCPTVHWEMNIKSNLDGDKCDRYK